MALPYDVTILTKGALNSLKEFLVGFSHYALWIACAFYCCCLRSTISSFLRVLLF